MDACGVGALPDAADYGDAGRTRSAIWPSRPAAWSCRRCRRSGSARSCRSRASRRRPRRPSTAGCGALGPGKESTTGHWELMGVGRRGRCRPTPRFPDAVVRALEQATGLRFCCQPAIQRHRRARRLRRAPPGHRRGDPLHLGRLGAAARRARRRAVRARAVRRLRGGPRGHERRARGRARDRAAVRGARRGVAPARPAAATSRSRPRPLLPAGASGRRAAGPRRRQDPRPVRRRRGRRQARRGDERRGDRGDDGAAPRARRPG